MILTSYNDEPLYLLNHTPDFTVPFEVTFNLLSASEIGLTNREFRRPLSVFPRLTHSMGVIAVGLEARKLDHALGVLTDERVALPFWPAVKRGGVPGESVLSGSVNVAFRSDWSLWEVFGATVPGWVEAEDWTAPLVFGRLTEKAVRWFTAEACSVTLRHVEASPVDLALSPPSASFASGPLPSSAYLTAPKVFLPQINFIGPEQTFAVNLQREDLGFGRESSQTVYGLPILGQTTEHVAMTPEAIALVVRFWIEHAAGRAFWLPMWHSACRLAEDLGDGETILSVDDTFGVAPGDSLAFIRGDGSISFARVLDNAGGNVTLDSAPGALREADCVVARLALVRFTAPRLTLHFPRLDVATFALPVRELGAEYVPPAGEDLGVSIGVGFLKAFLYQIRQTRAGLETVRRLTSHEADLTVDGELFHAAKITHGELVRGTALDRDELTLRHALDVTDSDHPFLRLATLRSLEPIRVVVREVELLIASNCMTNFTLLLNQSAAVDGAAVLTSEMRRFVCYLIATGVTTGATVTVEARMPDDSWAPVHVEIFTATGTRVLSWEGVFSAVRAGITSYTNGTYTAYLVASPS